MPPSKLIPLTLLFCATFSFAQPPDTLWTHLYGQQPDLADAIAVVPTMDGGFIYAGNTGWIADGGVTTGVLRKVNANGIEQWYRPNLLPPDSVGPLLYDFIALCDGNFVATGISDDQQDPALVIKINSDGDTVWTLKYGSNYENALKVYENIHHELLIVGKGVQLGLGGYPVVAKVAAEGDLLWLREYPEYGRQNIRISSALSMDSVVVMCISAVDSTLYNGNIHFHFLTLDNAGNIVDSNRFGLLDSSVLPKEMIQSSEGGYFVNAESSNTLFKFSSDFSLEWANQLGTDDFPLIHNMIATEGGGIVFAWEEDIFYDPPWSAYYVFLARLNSEGDSVWTTLVGNPEYEFLAPILSKTLDGGYICAWVVDVFNSFTGIARLDVDTVLSVDQQPFLSPEQVYLSQNFPNPFNSSTTFSYSLPHDSEIKLSLFDLLGRESTIVFSGPAKSGNHNISFSATNLPSGIYFAQLISASQTLTQKIVLLR